MEKLEWTLLFIVQNGQVYLSKKKRGHGVGLYNGFGGKVKNYESIEEAMIREAKEEAGIIPTKYMKRGVVHFKEYIDGKLTHADMHVYVATAYEGVLTESEEMTKPEPFDLDKVPYYGMAIGDSQWVQPLLRGELVEAYVSYTRLGTLEGISLASLVDHNTIQLNLNNKNWKGLDK